MSQTKFKGSPVELCGELPKVGSSAPDADLCKGDLSACKISDFRGHFAVLNIFPSIDTPVCAVSVHKFNFEASTISNTKVLCISRDTPFAQGRFCSAEGIKNVVSLSDFRTGSFGKAYGVEIIDGILKGLLARAIVVINPDGNVVYTEIVDDITNEPDYSAALVAVRGT